MVPDGRCSVSSIQRQQQGDLPRLAAAVARLQQGYLRVGVCPAILRFCGAECSSELSSLALLRPRVPPPAVLLTATPPQVPDRDGVWKDIPGLPTRAYADDGEVLLPGGTGATTNLIPVVGVIVPIVAVILLFLMIFVAMIRHKIAPQYPGELPRFGLRQDISGDEEDDDEGDDDALCVEVSRVETRAAAAPHRRGVGPSTLAYGESQEMQLRTDFPGDDSLERAIAIACHNRDSGDHD